VHLAVSHVHLAVSHVHLAVSHVHLKVTYRVKTHHGGHRDYGEVGPPTKKPAYSAATINSSS